ncbi:[3-methyl-2-oxobutanoate dehydrogenase [lipoamide]] kinase, mitochondrial [Erysiphe necator]|nr:[3-methyl-2-oxobutanoate dehydrogenase [lipoamide]] kinase, mitochondrial [Erysiphe necator]
MNLGTRHKFLNPWTLKFLGIKRQYQFDNLLTWRMLHSEENYKILPYHEIAKYANQPLREISLGDLVKNGRVPISTKALFSSANFTLSLLPVRLAYQIKAIWHLPFITVANPNISKIYNNYLNSLSTLLSYDFKCITKLDEEFRFTKALIKLVESHSHNLSILAQGFLECRKYMSPKQVAKFLDEHLQMRIGTRLIAEQHIAIHNSFYQQQVSNSDSHHRISSRFIGILDTNLKPVNVINSCGSFVSDICESTYNVRPSWIIDGDSSTTLAFIPGHLQYMLTELLKNAFRATIENDMCQEPITITISSVPTTFNNSCQLASSNNGIYQNKHEYPAFGITIRIRDRGGGISSEKLPHIWSYSFTTFSEENIRRGRSGRGNEFKVNLDAGLRSDSIAGLGYGLPLARTYAQYFGGSVCVHSLHGWGCDVYLRLKGLGQINP